MSPCRSQTCSAHRLALSLVWSQLSIGCVRAKFAKHIAILILADATASALGFYLFGFAFAYGDNASIDGLNPAGNSFIGKQFFAMSNMAPTAYYNWVFQWTVSTAIADCLQAALSWHMSASG